MGYISFREVIRSHLYGSLLNSQDSRESKAGFLFVAQVLFVHIKKQGSFLQ